MTYQEFVNKYNGRKIDYDGAYGCQCWDLAQYYNVEVLNVPDSVLSGCGWVKNMILWDWKYAQLMEYFDEVDVHAMQQGDVCIWTSGEGGHIAIYDHYDGTNCWYFSQNPNPCQVMIVNMDGHHAFRRKSVAPPPPPEPTPVITPNVEPDIYRNQIEVLIDNLYVRVEAGTDKKEIGFANIGYYNYLETKEADGYKWYRIADNNWIASKESEWTKEHPKQQPTDPPTIPPTQPPEDYVKLKVLDRKDGNVLVNTNIWIKEN